jgi:hypothetical protein
MRRRKRMLEGLDEDILDHYCTVRRECPVAEIRTARFEGSPLVPQR